MRVLVSCLLLIFNFCIASSAFAQDQLIFAIDLIRHGDRTPLRDIPYSNYHWKEGFGQLTALGMQQEYQLGAKLRKKYVDTYHLLPPQYTAGSLYVRSSDLDRTLMSAQSFLLGLYPLGSGSILPGSKTPALPFAFQPIPIHTVAKSQENLLLPQTESSKFRDYLKRYVSTSPQWQQKMAAVSSQYPRWSQITGIKITDPSQIVSIADTLYIEQLHHVPLPKGLTQEDAQEIIDAGHWFMVAAFRPSMIGKMTEKDLLLMISNYLQAAATQKTQLKYILFSAHDSTQLGLMSALGVPLDKTPPYAADLNFYLFRKENQNYYIQVNYNGNAVTIPNCHNGTTCSLAEFAKITTPDTNEKMTNINHSTLNAKAIVLKWKRSLAMT